MESNTFLDFEKPIAELEGKIKELRHLTDDSDDNIASEVTRLEAKVDTALHQVYDKLTPWQKMQVARHPDRPHFLDYVSGLIDEFTPLHGDRAFGDDKALIGGLGRFRGTPVMVIGHEKGTGTAGRVEHNFGMAHPEGYRKAVRLMELAARFNVPILTFVDTPGAHPGVEAEERGQSEAIARSIECCLKVKVPFVVSIVGEGGSGGAMAIAAGNKVLMLEHSVYSVISPEGCASILWRDAARARDAAEALKLTAQDLLGYKVIDRIVEEPLGGAHRDPEIAMSSLGDAIAETLKDLNDLTPQQLAAQRRDKFLDMGRPGVQ
jgi:acetyl-CoA carboxylase carboxyl transferase subunit alpha